MDPNRNIEVLTQSIQKLLEEKRNRDTSGELFLEDEDDQLLLSRLLSQLESLKRDDAGTRPEPSSSQEAISLPIEVSKPDAETEKAGQLSNASNEITTREIMDELKKVKKQNSITHWLLSALIVVTLAWQFSEVSLILKVRDRLNHPFRSVGGILTRMLKQGKDRMDSERESSTSREDENEYKETHLLPSFKIPELPHVELPDFRLDDE